MKTYEEIMQAYKTARENENAVINDLKTKRDKLEEAADRYRRIAERKDKEREKLRKRINAARKSCWVDDIVKPLMDEVKAITGLPFNTSDLRTFGIGCECPVNAKDENGKYLAWVTFVPSFANDYEIRMYSGEMCNRYAPGTIGELNGGNNVEEPVTGIESVLANLRRNFPELNIA